jgi:hypothetical protein
VTVAHDEVVADHPLLAGLRRSHAWEDVTGDPWSIAPLLAGAPLRSWATIRVRAARGAPWDRALNVGVLGGGLVLVEDTCIRGDAVRFRKYLLRPRDGRPAPALPAQ